MNFFTTTQLSGKKALTPEGFLLLTEVALARCGEMIYGPGETKIEPGADRVVHIDRFPDEVFRQETLDSFSGKSVVDEHPQGWEQNPGDWPVNPSNWRELSMGVILNPRRGKGAYDDCMVADLLITDEDAIAAVLAGKRELSCSYGCDWIQTGPGRGYQKNIIGNHVALVEKGRCGAICSIGDRQPEIAEPVSKGASFMKSLKDRILCAFKSKDEAALTAALDSAPASVAAALIASDEAMPGTHVEHHYHGLTATPPSAGDRKWSDGALDAEFEKVRGEMAGDRKVRDDNHKSVMDALEGLKPKEDKPAEDNKEIEGALEEEAPAGTGDKARKASDSVYLIDSFQQTVADAEIIAPGIAIPVCDSKAKPTITYTAMCQLRAKALSLGNSDAATNAMIVAANGGREISADSLKTMACDRLRTLFNATAALKRQANAAAGGGNRDLRETIAAHAGDGTRRQAASGAITSIADLNRRNRERFGQKTA